MERGGRVSPDDPRHGTYAGAVAHWFDKESLCSACELSERRYRRRRQRRIIDGDLLSVPATGTLRRFQALMALGWRGPEIAKVAGVSINTLRSVGYHGSDRVLADTARRVRDAYDQLSMTVPEGPYANRTRLMAERRGWFPPLAWDDIDDPDAIPDLGAPDIRPANGGNPVVYMLEDAEWLAEDDRGLTYVLERLSVNRNTFRDACRREERMDLYWRLANREPDADNRRATRDGIRRSRGVA
jgi:hypothetical protein